MVLLSHVEHSTTGTATGVSLGATFGSKEAVVAGWGPAAACRLSLRQGVHVLLRQEDCGLGCVGGSGGRPAATSAARGQWRQRYCCLGRAAASGDSANAPSAVSGTVAVVQGPALAA